VDLGDFGQIPGPSSVLFWRVLLLLLLRGAFLCISYRGKLRQHKLIRIQCTKKSTRIPVSPVPSTGIRFKKVKIIKIYNPYTKILNFVLLIWEERNSGRYEHVRASACARRARAKKHTSPPTILSGSVSGTNGLIFCDQSRWIHFRLPRDGIFIIQKCCKPLIL
jgi:hypothetical protein